MNIRDKRAWLNEHGDMHSGQALDGNNVFFQWIPNNDYTAFIRFRPTDDEAIESVFDDAKNKLFNLCNGELV